MSLLRICASIPAVLVACAMASAALGGCYDLSTSGPHPEDFANAPSASAHQVLEQPQQSEAPEASAAALDVDRSDVDRSDALVEALGIQPSPR